MSVLRPTPAANDAEKALVLHSSPLPLPQPATSTPEWMPRSESGDLDLLDTLARHWLLALLVFAVTAGAGVLWAIKSAHSVYRAETMIYISPDLAKDTADGAGASYTTFVNQQLMMISQYDTLREAVQRLRQQSIPWGYKGETDRQAVVRLQAALEVQRIPDSYEISLQVIGSDPRIAAGVANTIAQTFLDQRRGPDASGHAGRDEALFVQKAAIERELKTKLEERAVLAESLEVVNLQKASLLPEDQILSYTNEAIAAAHHRRLEAQEALAGERSTIASDAEQLASADPAGRSVVSNLLSRQLELRERIRTMLPAHPVRKQAEIELAAIDAEFNKASDDQILKARAQLMAKMRAQADVSSRIEMDLRREFTQEAAHIPDRTRSLDQGERLNAEITRLREHLSRIEDQLEEISLRNPSELMRIFALAEPPSTPMQNQKKKTLGLVFAIALILGLAVPVALDLVDSRIWTAATIERILGTPILGMTIKPSATTSQFADEHFRRLVGRIERGVDHGARTIVLTGLKQPVPSSLLEDISRELSDQKINVTLRFGVDRIESSSGVTNHESNSVAATVSITDTGDRDVTLIEAPALILSADAERLVARADMTLVMVEAGQNTRSDLICGGRLLRRLNVSFVGVVLQDVRLERAGRSLRREWKEYVELRRWERQAPSPWGQDTSVS
jgi:succinoglycan biosynthesis transport protein ExoP